MRKDIPLCKIIFVIFFLILFCEFLIYYIVISQCYWPILKEDRVDSTVEIDSSEYTEAVKAIFIADTHLFESNSDHWFDKFRREWHMFNSFHTVMSLLKPEVVFILGDLFDHGNKRSDTEFQHYVEKLYSFFKVPEDTKIYFIAGNHDIGLHFAVTPQLHDRFAKALKSPPVQVVTIRGNHFVLINSMAMEGDGCFFCRQAQVQIQKISNKLKCAKGIGKCSTVLAFKPYSRPILLQHFPMYRNSDRQCFEPDEAPEDVKKQEFHERWDCLSREASEMIYDSLMPRLIIGGHTHHGCHVVHRQDIHEYTLPSFNWKNKNNPSLILGQFVPNNYAVNKCYIPQESTIIFLYCLGFFFIVLWIILKFKPRKTRISFSRFF